jgi:hypothetical protein
LGAGVAKDLVRAAHYYKLSADQGDVYARNALEDLRRRDAVIGGIPEGPTVTAPPPTDEEAVANPEGAAAAPAVAALPPPHEEAVAEEEEKCGLIDPEDETQNLIFKDPDDDDEDLFGGEDDDRQSPSPKRFKPEGNRLLRESDFKSFITNNNLKLITLN